MTTLDPTDGYLVLINTFKVDPKRAEELCELLARATEETMRGQPGFVSASLHVSLDRKHVANYAQWRSKEVYEAIFEDSAVAEHMKDAAEMAESFAPILYELRHSIEASS